MRICVVSEDPSLLEWFREILNRPCAQRAELVAVGPRGHIPDQAGVFVWDVNGMGESLASWVEARVGAHHILLVRREQLRLLEQVVPGQACTILLKPLDRAQLRVILEPCLVEGCSLPQRIAFVEKERDSLLECLLDTNLLLQEYDQQRGNFLARAAHDLRAPLTALNGYSGLLLSGRLGGLGPRQAEVLQRMQHSIQRLARTATAMLELSGARLAEPKLVLQEASIEACVRRALHELLPITGEKNLGIAVHLEPPSQALRFDAARIEQVLLNLLGNACRFTPHGGAIEVRGFPCVWDRSAAGPGVSSKAENPGSRAPNAYRVEVTDSGPAMPEEWLERIFEADARYEGGRDRSGEGLDLAVCRLILRAHQGEVFAFASPRGFTFAFVLPHPRCRIARADPNPVVALARRRAGVIGARRLSR